MGCFILCGSSVWVFGYSLEAMMNESLPDWVSVPLIIILGLVALYRCYILPGYLKDRESRDSQNGTL